MANGTEAASAGKGAGKSGRTGRDGQEAVLRPTEVADKIDHLEKLYIKAQESSKDLNDAIKKVAEKSGYLASNIRTLVAARVKDKFVDKKRDAEQQLSLFDEVGE
jgi:DNA repair exonuclease SbcCD ATPase subunit